MMPSGIYHQPQVSREHRGCLLICWGASVSSRCLNMLVPQSLFRQLAQLVHIAEESEREEAGVSQTLSTTVETYSPSFMPLRSLDLPLQAPSSTEPLGTQRLSLPSDAMASYFLPSSSHVLPAWSTPLQPQNISGRPHKNPQGWFPLWTATRAQNRKETHNSLLTC